MAKELSTAGSVPRHPRRHGKPPILPLFLCGIAAACGVFLYMGLSGYKDMRDMVLTWTEIAKVADTEDPDAPEEYVVTGSGSEDGPSVVAVSSQAPLDQGGDVLYRPINLKALRDINPDVSGYIYIPGTNVDYPILKETEPEEYFYINHNMYKASDQYGSIFELCDEERGVPGIDNPVTWLFGHHMRSGSMFATLYNYEDPAFHDTPIYVYRDDWRAEYRAFAYCHVDYHDSVYAFSDYARGSSEYEWLLGHLEENDLMRTGLEWPDKDDDMLILSTCYGGTGTKTRMILLCTEIRRAMVPEYYNSLQEVEQFGGDSTPVDASEIEGYEPPDDGINGMAEIGVTTGN